MEGGKRKEVENEEARDREELFNIGVFLILLEVDMVAKENIYLVS